MLHARVSARPVDGAANRALIALVSDRFHLPRSRISLISGGASRIKTLELDGLQHEELLLLINNLFPQQQG